MKLKILDADFAKATSSVGRRWSKQRVLAAVSNT